MATASAAKQTRPSSIEQRGSLEDFEFTWPGSNASIQLHEVVIIMWTQEIDSEEIGALWIYLVDKLEESRIMISRKYAQTKQAHLCWEPARVPKCSILTHRTGNVTGSDFVWTIPLNVEFFVEGRSYYFKLEVFPKYREARSENIKLIAESSFPSTSTLTASSVITTEGTTSTQVITRTIVNSAISSQTALPSTKDEDFAGTLESDYSEPSESNRQSLSIGAVAGMAAGGTLLGVFLFLLLGIFIYRRKSSQKKHRKVEGYQDAAAVSFSEQRPSPNIPEMEAFRPKADISDNTVARGHTAASGDLYEME